MRAIWTPRRRERPNGACSSLSPARRRIAGHLRGRDPEGNVSNASQSRGKLRSDGIHDGIDVSRQDMSNTHFESLVALPPYREPWCWRVVTAFASGGFAVQ